MKEVWIAYKKGMAKLYLLKRYWLWIYLANLITALLIALPIKFIIDKNVGQSVEMNEISGGFDLTLIADFVNNFGLSLQSISLDLLLIVPIYFVLNVFLMAGVSDLVVSDSLSSSKAKYLLSCQTYFGRFLRLSLYYVIAFLIILAIGVLFYAAGGLSPFEQETDLRYINRLYWILPFVLISVLIVHFLKDLSRIFILLNPKKKVLSNIFSSMKFLAANAKASFGMLLLNFLTFLLVGAVYYLMKNMLNFEIINVLILLCISQFFIFIRLGLRIGIIADINELIRMKMVK